MGKMEVNSLSVGYEMEPYTGNHHVPWNVIFREKKARDNNEDNLQREKELTCSQ